MAYVCEPIYASTVSASNTIHTCSRNIWLCSSNTASISACPYMALILSMGRAQGWDGHHGHLLTVPCHQSVPYQTLCISPPSWDAKSWCRWSWKWWRVFKPKMQFSLLQSRGPTHVEPCPHPLEAANFLLSLAWGAAHGVWAELEPHYWTKHDLVLVRTSVFFFFWLYYSHTGKNKTK